MKTTKNNFAFIAAFKKTPDFKSGDELNADMSSSFRGNPAFQSGEDVIDSQNLNLGVRSQGWKLDLARFRIYLKDKYNVEKAFLFIGDWLRNSLELKKTGISGRSKP